MSTIGTENYTRGFVVDVSDDGGDASVQRAAKILAGIPRGVYRAVGSALKRAATSGKTQAVRAAVQEYAITQATFKANLKNVNHFRKDDSSLEVVFGFRGHVIPLIRFDTTYTKDGHVYARVKHGGTKTQLDNAFFGTVGSHVGVFERTTTKRFPIKELYGPSTAQMMYSNEAVSDRIIDAAQVTYEKRIEVEITRILNGYGGANA
jgi:hypothetical protein